MAAELTTSAGAPGGGIDGVKPAGIAESAFLARTGGRTCGSSSGLCPQTIDDNETTRQAPRMKALNVTQFRGDDI